MSAEALDEDAIRRCLREAGRHLGDARMLEADPTERARRLRAARNIITRSLGEVALLQRRVERDVPMVEEVPTDVWDRSERVHR